MKKKSITSKEIKEILDTSKVPLKEESIIMDYIYELEDKLKRIDEYIEENAIYVYKDNQKELLRVGIEDIQDIIRGEDNE